MLSFLHNQYRDQNGVWSEEQGDGGRTYISVPLEMFVDEPEGNDGGHDSKAAGYKPSDIMRYEVYVQSILRENMRTITDLEIRYGHAEREKAPSGVPWA